MPEIRLKGFEKNDQSEQIARMSENSSAKNDFTSKQPATTLGKKVNPFPIGSMGLAYLHPNLPYTSTIHW